MSEVVDDPIRTGVGRAIHRARKDAGLSMRELADRCNVSQPFISAMERGQSMPSIDTLYRLATVLGVEPATLLPVQDSDEITVIRAGSGELVASTDGPQSATGRLLLSDPERRLEIFEYTIEPGDDLDAWFEHPGTVVLRLQTGVLDVELAGHETVRLHAGDSLVHPGQIPHRWCMVDRAGVDGAGVDGAGVDGAGAGTQVHLFLVISRAGAD